MTEEQKPTGEEKPVEQSSPVEEAPKELEIEKQNCPTCKVRKLDADLIKQPLGWKKDADGNIKGDIIRCTVFCKQCQTVLTVIDPDAAKELNKIKKERS
jgi:hypothetical protein